ncbi:hypothetical protein F4802DRAFT_571304 [Xylaria palmicola]|nr:hypothetical protein F4802DRAFT_571304 [Xylaria palmicola]
MLCIWGVLLGFALNILFAMAIPNQDGTGCSICAVRSTVYLQVHTTYLLDRAQLSPPFPPFLSELVWGSGGEP